MCVSVCYSMKDSFWPILMKFDIAPSQVTWQDIGSSMSHILSHDNHSRQIYHFLQQLDREKYFHSEIKNRKWELVEIHCILWMPDINNVYRGYQTLILCILDTKHQHCVYHGYQAQILWITVILHINIVYTRHHAKALYVMDTRHKYCLPSMIQGVNIARQSIADNTSSAPKQGYTPMQTIHLVVLYGSITGIYCNFHNN